MRPDR